MPEQTYSASSVLQTGAQEVQQAESITVVLSPDGVRLICDALGCFASHDGFHRTTPERDAIWSLFNSIEMKLVEDGKLEKVDPAK